MVYNFSVIKQTRMLSPCIQPMTLIKALYRCNCYGRELHGTSMP